MAIDWGYMDTCEAVRQMINRSGRSQYDVSAAIGRSPAYISATLARGSDLQGGTLARIADACGYDLQLVKRDGGEVLGRIDPPTRE